MSPPPAPPSPANPGGVPLSPLFMSPHPDIPETAADVELRTRFEDLCSNSSLTVVVLGASGDLAKKKTFPALFGLLRMQLLPSSTQIIGFARSQMDEKVFHDKIVSYIKNKDDVNEELEVFKKMCTYVSGQYDQVDSFKTLLGHIQAKEGNSKASNRIFYMALPPSVFVDVGNSLKESGCIDDRSTASNCGWSRVIVEKPFGHDLESSNAMGAELAKVFTEEQVYRIDHYLGKEMVQNLMTIRFANFFFSPLWNKDAVKVVMITFKEPIGTEGRGGYFDQFGIIRDVMQNHLLQILALVAMEQPKSMSPEHVRDAKVNVLKATRELKLEDTVLGQYVGYEEKEPGRTVIQEGYLDDEGVPNDSVTPTFCTAVFHIDNDRWRGVPFILKAGKALNERKAEVRVQFHDPPSNLFGPEIARNELVIRVQPDEAVYIKFNAKNPGLSTGTTETELDLSYNHRYSHVQLPDAYERLIYDCIMGNHENFVRSDELEAAWKIFTPLLHRIEGEKIKPLPYVFGSRGPKESDDLISKHGYVRSDTYSWKKGKL